VIGLNASYLAELKSQDESCGYAPYRDQYMTFPASGIQPPIPDFSDECDINTAASNAAFNVNPCFNSYEIVTQCPIPSGKNPNHHDLILPNLNFYTVNVHNLEIPV